MEKRRQKKLLTIWECLNHKKIFTTAAIVCHRQGRLAVLQNVFAIILLSATKDVENVSKKLYTSKIKKKQRRKVALGTLKIPKLARILEKSSSTRQVCVSVVFRFWSLYKTNRFHVALGLFSNRSQRTSKCGKNISLPAARVPLLCF